MDLVFNNLTLAKHSSLSYFYAVGDLCSGFLSSLRSSVSWSHLVVNVLDHDYVVEVCVSYSCVSWFISVMESLCEPLVGHNFNSSYSLFYLIVKVLLLTPSLQNCLVWPNMDTFSRSGPKWQKLDHYKSITNLNWPCLSLLHSCNTVRRIRGLKLIKSMFCGWNLIFFILWFDFRVAQCKFYQVWYLLLYMPVNVDLQIIRLIRNPFCFQLLSYCYFIILKWFETLEI